MYYWLDQRQFGALGAVTEEDRNEMSSWIPWGFGASAVVAGILMSMFVNKL